MSFANFGNEPKTALENSETKEEGSLASTTENEKLQQREEVVGDSTIENVAQVIKEEKIDVETKTTGSGEVIENKTVHDVSSGGNKQPE